MRLNSTERTDLRSWIPTGVRWDEGKGVVEWRDIAHAPFTEPFFHQTIERTIATTQLAPARRWTPIDVLGELEFVEATMAPRGFVFHMSRCGSTLVSQMLASLPQNHVVSEAEPIHTVLRAESRLPGVSDGRRAGWLRGLLAALSYPRAAGQLYFFVKFDSWDTLDLGFIRQVFPTVPWVFIYRHPLEVMVSHELQDAQSTTHERASHRAGIVGRFCQAALAHVSSGGRLIEYQQLPDAVWTEMSVHFSLDYSPADIARMQAVSTYNAKQPSVIFSPDSEAKRSAASVVVRDVVERTLMPLYEQLEACRRRAESR